VSRKLRLDRHRTTSPLIAGAAAGCAVGAILALIYDLPWAALVGVLAAVGLFGYSVYARGP